MLLGYESVFYMVESFEDLKAADDGRFQSSCIQKVENEFTIELSSTKPLIYALIDHSNNNLLLFFSSVTI